MSAEELEALLRRAGARHRARPAAASARRVARAGRARGRTARAARARRASSPSSAGSATSCAPRSAASTTKPKPSARSAADANQKLYSGTVSSPRELQAMQADIDMLRRQRCDLEDRELEVMEARESLDGEIADARGRTRAQLQQDATRLAGSRSRRPRPRSTRSWPPKIAAARGRPPAASRRALVRDYETPTRAEPRRGRGAARRHDLPGVPPLDPVDRGRAHPTGRGRRRRVLRQLRRDPRPVTQPSLPFEADRRRTGSTRCVIYCDGGSRGNPGPSAIGAVVFDPSTDAARRVLATVSECIGVTTNNVAEYQALHRGARARSRTARARASTCAPTRCS